MTGNSWDGTKFYNLKQLEQFFFLECETVPNEINLRCEAAWTEQNLRFETAGMAAVASIVLFIPAPSQVISPSGAGLTKVDPLNHKYRLAFSVLQIVKQC